MRNHFEQLKKLLGNSYSPYSHFATAAIAITDVGEFKGVNVENSSFGATVCAERNAIFNAITNGAKKFEKLLLISNSLNDDIIPCAICLQVMTEFFDQSTIIEVTNYDGSKHKKYYLSDLLPISFSKKQMQEHDEYLKGKK